MAVLYVIIAVIFIAFVITCIVGLIQGIVRFFWPILLILGIYYLYKSYKQRKYLESKGEYTSAPKYHSASDIFEADYVVKHEEEVYEVKNENLENRGN